MSSSNRQASPFPRLFPKQGRTQRPQIPSSSEQQSLDTAQHANRMPVSSLKQSSGVHRHRDTQRPGAGPHSSALQRPSSSQLQRGIGQPGGMSGIGSPAHCASQIAAISGHSCGGRQRSSSLPSRHVRRPSHRPRPSTQLPSRQRNSSAPQPFQDIVGIDRAHRIRWQWCTVATQHTRVSSGGHNSGRSPRSSRTDRRQDVCNVPGRDRLRDNCSLLIGSFTALWRAFKFGNDSRVRGSRGECQALVRRYMPVRNSC